MSSSSNVTDVGTKDENKMSNSSSSEILKKKTESASKKNTNNNKGSSESGSGWVTVQKKEKPEKQRFARKGRHGLAWRVPNDSTNEKKNLIKKKQNRKKRAANTTTNKSDKGSTTKTKDKEINFDKDPPLSKKNTSSGDRSKKQVKPPSKNSWAAAVLRGTNNNSNGKSSKKSSKSTSSSSSSSSASTPKRAARMAIPVGKKGGDNETNAQQTFRRSSSNSSNKNNDGDDLSSSSTDPFIREKLRLRKQLQSILFQNVNQAVDELYYICEFDSEIESAVAALELMAEWRDSFQTLVDTVKLQKEYEALRKDMGDNNIDESSSGLEKSGSALKKKGSVAWEIKKSSPASLSGINQIVESVLKRANKSSSQQSQKIIASLRPYDQSNSGLTFSSSSVSMPKRNGGDGGNEDADNEQQQQQQQQQQEVITTLSGVVDEDGNLNHSRSPGMLEKSQSNIEDEEDDKNDSSTNSSGNNATTQVLEMLRLDNTSSTGLWGDMMMSEEESDDDDDDSDDDDDYRQQSPPSPARSSPPEKQRSLHAKLSSPDRAKPTPMEAQRKFIEKQSLARINREKIKEEKKAWLNIRETRLRTSKEQREKMLAEKESTIQTRLKAASDRRDERMANIRKRAESENDKISEIVFINNLTQENRAREIKRRIDEGSERARKHKEEIVNSKRTRHTRIEESANEVREKLQKEVMERKEMLQNRLKQAELQRQKIVKAKEDEKKKKEAMAKERLEMLNKKAEEEREKIRKLQEKKEAKALEIRNAKEKAMLDKKLRQEEAANARKKSLEEEALAAKNAKKMEMKLREDRAQLNHRRSIEAKKANANLRNTLQLSPRHTDEMTGEVTFSSAKSPKRGSPKRGSPKRKGSNTSPPKRKGSTDNSNRKAKVDDSNSNNDSNSNLKIGKKINSMSSTSTTSTVDSNVQANVNNSNTTSAETKLAKKNAQKAKKRQMKKCKQKMTSFWEEFAEKVDETSKSDVDSNTTNADDNKTLHRLFADLVTLPSGSEERINKFRTIIRSSKSKPFENQTAALFRTSKVFANILSICTREMTDRAPHVVTSALRIVELAIIKDFDNRIYFHANGAVGQISSILSFALTDAIEKVDPESSNRVKSEWNHQLLIACLRVLAVSLNTSKVEWIPYEYYENIATLFTIARHVEKLGELYRLYELQLGASGSIRKTQTMDVMLNGLHFLSSFASSLVQDNYNYSSSSKNGNNNRKNIRPLPSNVSESLGGTCISGLLSLLFSMADSKESWETGIVLNALDVMNIVARLDVRMFQRLLSSPSLQPQFYHVLNSLLDKSSMSDIKEGANMEVKDEVIKKSLILMGYHALSCQKNQESLNWGTQTTALQRICSLPFRFFSEEANKHVLFPTLIAVCYENKRNTSVVEQELSVDMIVEYIEKMMESRKNSEAQGKILPQERDDLDNKENDPVTRIKNDELDSKKGNDKDGDMWSLVISKGKNADPLQWNFEQRFPASLWDDALKFFISMSS